MRKKKEFKESFVLGWLGSLDIFLSEKDLNNQSTENEGTENHSPAHNHHLLQKLISHSALLVKESHVGREGGHQQREDGFCALLPKEPRTK